MAFTLTQYQALQAAIGSGELTVKYDGKEVTYRSINELLKAASHVAAELAATGQLSVPGSSGVVRGGTTFADYDPS